MGGSGSCAAGDGYCVEGATTGGGAFWGGCELWLPEVDWGGAVLCGALLES
jgi:hypothetical protein